MGVEPPDLVGFGRRFQGWCAGRRVPCPMRRVPLHKGRGRVVCAGIVLFSGGGGTPPLAGAVFFLPRRWRRPPAEPVSGTRKSVAGVVFPVVQAQGDRGGN